MALLARMTLLAFAASALVFSQQPSPAPASVEAQQQEGPTAAESRLDVVRKQIDDQLWFAMLSDIATLDKVTYTSRPPHHIPNPTGQGAKNPLIIHAYTFLPKTMDRNKKQPLLVFAHGGVHGDFDTSNAHIVREMIQQGYAVIAPDYRGSTGYGGSFYRDIDYGDYEVDDVYAARQWMLESYPFLDPKRVGMIGWSHGGLITLMNIFQHPGDYAVAYAGVPVSDLVQRLGYKGPGYAREYSAKYHIGKSVADDVQEYRRRSPVSYASKLNTPLLIHTNTNDEDVNVLEVEHLIEALKAEGKKFEYKIYPDAPGGHLFNRLDTKLARDSRQEVYRFLAQYLKPGQ